MGLIFKQQLHKILQQEMSVWAQYRSEGRHLKMLMTTTRNLSMMKAWVVDTGLIPREAELDEGLKTDLWGILTPSRNRLDKDNIIVCDDEEDEESMEEPNEDIEKETKNEHENKPRP